MCISDALLLILWNMFIDISIINEQLLIGQYFLLKTIDESNCLVNLQKLQLDLFEDNQI